MGTSLLKKLYDLKPVSGCFRGGTLSKSDTTQNTNIVVAMAKAGNWGQAGLAVGLGWQVGARLTDNLSAISCATIMNRRWDLLLTLKSILIIGILFDLFCYFCKIITKLEYSFLFCCDILCDVSQLN